MAAKLTTRQFRSLYVMAHNTFTTTSSSTSIYGTVHGRIDLNTFTTELDADDYRTLTSAGLVETCPNYHTGNIEATLTDAGRAVLARNNTRRTACDALMEADSGQSMHRALRGLAPLR